MTKHEDKDLNDNFNKLWMKYLKKGLIIISLIIIGVIGIIYIIFSIFPE